MEEDESPRISVISCMHFVKRGVAKAVPDQVQLSEQELETIIKQTTAELRISAEGEDESDAEEETLPTISNASVNPDDEFNFEEYDTEGERNIANTLGLGSLATYAYDGSLSENVRINLDGPDSDAEDDIIKPTDNLILLGHVQGDASVLEVYVYNEDEGSLYVHHDLLLPWFPLCIEWLNRDPTDNEPASLCALGGMDPVIQVWDLDILDCLEPAFKLGRKPNKKKNIKRVGHKNAVMDLSWNKNFEHVMASSSVDKTVLLWDVDKGDPHTKLSYFEDKVQTIQWHSLEAQTLLSGCCDGKARVSDCRQENSFKWWPTGCEIERAHWDALKPFCFAASTNDGHVVYVDCRQDDPLWKMKMHEKDITGLSLSSQCPGLMVTVGSDGFLKTWDISENQPLMVSEKNLGIGEAQCMAVCPENPFVLAVGGDNKERNFSVWNITKNEDVQQRFGSRQLVTMAVDEDNI